MKIAIPEFSLVVLIGPSASGKTTFARQYFKPTEILSSDFCRGLVSDNETDQSVTREAFEVLHFIAAKRLAACRLTVIDATNVQPEARKPFISLACDYNCMPIAIVLNMSEAVCLERHQQRTDRDFGPYVIRNQILQLRRSIRRLEQEGFRRVYILSEPDDLADIAIERHKLWSNLKHDHGPFDIIGDVHGCCDELERLLENLGYEWSENDRFQINGSKGQPGSEKFLETEISTLYKRVYRHPGGRKAIFLGDLFDRGPRVLDTWQLVRNMVRAGTGLCVVGNHDVKVMRMLRGAKVQIKHGLQRTRAELESLPENVHALVSKEIIYFINSLISHYVLDDGKLVVAHAGMKETLQGRGSNRVRQFALYGDTTGETDEFGLPVRHNWAAEYRGQALVVYGHTPVPAAEWLNGTINIDTGCVFGGQLTVLRYPERELAAIPALRTYTEPVRPLVSSSPDQLTAQQRYDDVLDLNDVLGKRIISTRLRANITIREENSIAALEVMSRFAINPRWLIYLPPTMSPSETSDKPGFLEHPEQAFAYYQSQGVSRVVCEEKHMGSRAVVIVCRNEETAQRRFGIRGDGLGVCYTRTGRRFFNNRDEEVQLLEQVRSVLDATGFWKELKTDWVCLDCELMPWSTKAQELLQTQYAAVGASAREALRETVAVLQQAGTTGAEVTPLFDYYQERADMTTRYVEAYRRYCWPVNSVNDLKLAPFHILATEGMVHFDKNHTWHMETIKKYICTGETGCLLATPYKSVELTDPVSVADGITWWQELTDQGGEGMVVKPLSFVVRNDNSLIQPAIKCRGREYLRIIYGPEYTTEQHLVRLRQRGLSAKRSLALREFALGIEALERFVNREPLRRVHECVFGVLALESEPVDPRL